MADMETEDAVRNPGKRSRSEADPESHDNNGSISSSEDDFGPALPTAQPKKKRRKLPYEKLYISALPNSTRYSKSLMHKEQLSFTTITPHTDFLITSSVDGVVKFWKKMAVGVEFVKEYRAHAGDILSVSVSADGRSFATTGADQTVKIFDVVTFDLLAALSPDFTPSCVCWVHPRGASLPLLAVAGESNNTICIFDGRGENQVPLHTLSHIHRTSVVTMAYNNTYDCVVSADNGGMLEYWRPSENFEKPDGLFDLKSSTDLFAFKKAKSSPVSLVFSPSGHQFATFSFPDRQIRIFDFQTGKLYRSYDESLTTLTDMQQAGTALQKLEEVEFGRRMAVERDLQNPVIAPKINVVFDESGHFVLYGSILGIKCINTYTNRVVKVYGKDEPFRALNLAVYQGQPQKKGVVTVSMAASANPLLQEAEERDPVLICTGFAKPRFYIFSNETDISKSTRDVQNEKPRHDRDVARAGASEKQVNTGTSAILHTTMGDIHLRLFPSVAPKAVENFVTHARNGYYNNTIFHRVIRKFMIQGGDPLGDGTGGESIWGKEFEDEFSSLSHDSPFTLSMANAGSNTNGSQFFITTEKTPWLDGHHTIFGRAIKGLDVVHQIENVKTYKEKPEVDVKIISISTA
ncbi:Peptidyl-prolyl cis-trans isomerase cyp15 [Ophidiomyces ophidiicola]|uniref:Peptidyl-prolyl cis-trans isomerase cyp15 n=1 Tax=Ophidiomyces ophidiicola TaxID=1387563 RepID=UPI0020C2D7DE|nr:Peptidyl-prolyl cis-trans isomerase cyp15 [Ophidiomyces ophidiicola]KAI1954243.1 Peptidyl-prolyl cis-trans isomerase cyp15 [Ophidiomyces ophidiicola]KAI2049729.1 Peptidyl-prolyl cis-trans isomerase cyp15 [Ophidiomyces ophidiicola]KAI2084168.1 Peptidyl-prolyl cis-trans isomerase cyp15 [Ophidiomyces ophidiicola]